MTDAQFTGPGVDEVADIPLADTPLESLKMSVAKIRNRSDIVTLAHPGAKPGHIELTYNRRKVTDYDHLSKLRDGSQTDQQLFSLALLREASEDIVIDGKPSGISLGSDDQMCAITGMVDPIAAVKAFFDDNFIWIASHAQDLVAESGKPSDDGLDPTRRTGSTGT